MKSIPPKFIAVVGKRAEEQAKAIALHFGLNCKHSLKDGMWKMRCSTKAKDAFYESELSFESTCEEVSSCTGVHIDPDDIRFTYA